MTLTIYLSQVLEGETPPASGVGGEPSADEIMRIEMGHTATTIKTEVYTSMMVKATPDIFRRNRCQCNWSTRISDAR